MYNMEENLTQKSIDLALVCNWKDAIKTNLLILKNDGDDIDALNRLAHAYFANGSITNAKKISLKVLKINPTNNIATKALEKCNQGKQKGKSSEKYVLYPSDFIEEPGKTKLTSLINLGSLKIYSCLNTGTEVLLTPHAHKVSVTTVDGEYIGKLTDDLSSRLRKFIKSGNKYKVLIKSASKNRVIVFIRGNNVSFPLEMSESISEFSS